MSLSSPVSVLRPAVRILSHNLSRGLIGALLIAGASPLYAGSTAGTSGLMMPQGSGAATANGDYVSATAGLNTFYRYYIEVPSAASRLQIQIFDADVGAGGAAEANAGRDRDRGGFNSSVTYSLIDPSGNTRTALFTTGTTALPAGADNAWLDFYNVTGNSVRDNFSAAAYTNNDGNNNWTGAWVETDGGGGGAVSGSIQVTGGELRLQDVSPGSASIYREANLSMGGLNLGSAFLTFSYRTSGTLETSGKNRDDILLEVSSNGGGSWATLETFTGDSTGTRSYNITSYIATNTRVRWSVNGLTDTDEFFYVDNVQITDGEKTAGHWELRVDMSSAVTGGDDINAIGIRAHDGDSTSGGTELNVYFDSHNQLGTNPAPGASSRSYGIYPYLTSGCTASKNDYDYDSNTGTVGSMSFSSRSGAYSQTFDSSQLSGNDVWRRDTISTWASDNNAIDYGIWLATVTINTYTASGTVNGNYTTFYVTNSQAAANPPTSNPSANSFRVYLPTDAGGAPVKPYVEQQLRHDSGPNPPVNGQTSSLTVTVRVVNPTAHAITFSASNLVTARIPGGGAVYGGSAQVSQGSIVSQPAVGGTGDITWNLGTLAAGATALLAYEVDITPTAVGQRIAATGTPASGNGTRAQYVDETGNTTQSRATYLFGPLCELAVTEGLLTHAVVSSFQTFADPDGVRVEWQTASEAGTAGFYLYRWDEAARQYRKVTERLLPGLIHAPQGGTYRFLDEDADPNAAHTYLLVEVETGGDRRSYGPYSGRPAAERLDGLRSARAMSSTGAYEREAHAASRSERPEVPAGTRKRARAAANAAVAGENGVHLAIRETGLYHLSTAEIASWFGLDPAAAAAEIGKGRFQLTRGDRTAVHWFPDIVAGKKKEAQGIFFYAEAAPSQYGLDTVYWLQAGRGSLMAVEGMTGASPGGGAATFPETRRAETDAFAATAISPDPESDYWFWSFLVGNDPSFGKKTFALDAPGLPAAASGAASLEVHLYGATGTGVAGEHRATVTVNGTLVGEMQWQGIAPYSEVFPLDAALLLETGNQIVVTAATGNGAPYSIQYVDGFELGYPRRFQAAGDTLAFTPGGNPQVTVSGLSAPTVRLLDITEPLRPRWIEGPAAAADPAGAGYSLSFVPYADARYLAAGPGGIKVPAAVRPWSSADLAASYNRADALIVTPSALRPAAERLASLRRGQGLEVVVADLDEVMDNFNGGASSPHAIRDFLAYAWQSWTKAPRYVTLIGEGSLDYRNLLGYGDCVLPPLMVRSTGGLFPADSRLGDVDGDGLPEMAVGRLPVRTEAELDAYLAKITAYENQAAADWARGAMMLADTTDGGADFAQDSDAIASLLPGDYTVDRIYLSTTPIVDARSRLLHGLQSGASLVNFLGHGGLDRLSSRGLLTSSDVAGMANAERLPVLTAMTCTVNRYAVPGVPSLGEVLVKKAGGGAAAVWGPSGLSLHGEARQLAELFYRQVSEPAVSPSGARLGDWILRSTSEFAALGGDGSMLEIYNLLGDPALRVQRAPATPPSSTGSGGE